MQIVPSIASVCFAYCAGIGLLRKGAIIRHSRSAENRSMECGGGIAYQQHRETLKRHLKGVLLDSVRCTVLLCKFCWCGGCNGNQRWYWMQVLGILFMTTTVVAMNSFMDKIGGYLVSSIPAELSTEYVVQQTQKYAQAAKQVRSEFPP